MRKMDRHYNTFDAEIDVVFFVRFHQVLIRTAIGALMQLAFVAVKFHAISTAELAC